MGKYIAPIQKKYYNVICAHNNYCFVSCSLFTCYYNTNKGQQNSNYVHANVVGIRPKSSIYCTLFMSSLLAYIKMLLEKYGPYGSGKRSSITRANRCPNLLITTGKLTTKWSNGTSSSGYSTMSVDDSSNIQCYTKQMNDDNPFY